MMLAISALKGYAIEASDGRIGTVGDFLFEDTSWRIRWLVADTGTWLTERKVLVHPSAIGPADHQRRGIRVRLTKSQVEKSPDISKDQPVSRQMESHLYEYYGWDPYWGASYFGAGAIAMPFSSPPLFGAPAVSSAAGLRAGAGTEDSHLRSITAVTGYHIHATDGTIGHVESFLIDDSAWDIRYLIVDTRNWWPGKHVLLSPYAVLKIVWADRQILLNVSRDQVKAIPPWDPIEVVEQAYEKQLHGHYGWPGYGF